MRPYSYNTCLSQECPGIVRTNVGNTGHHSTETLLHGIVAIVYARKDLSTAICGRRHACNYATHQNSNCVYI